MAEKEPHIFRDQVEETKKKVRACLQRCQQDTEVLQAAQELESLLDWTASSSQLNPSVLLRNLQHLEHIQQDLEKTVAESDLIHFQSSPESLCLDEIDKSEAQLSEDNLPRMLSPETQINLLDNCLEKVAFHVPTRPHSQPLNECETAVLVDLEPTHVEPSSDHLGLSGSEDEGLGEESRRADSTGPSSLVELQPFDIIRLVSPEKPELSNLDGSKRVPQEAANSLDVCMCVIANLRESLTAKENELMKLSVIQDDQRQISALQDVIVSLHQEATSLKLEIEKLTKQNGTLREQILELEEAENDARLQAQNLGEKLVFLQEKDTHFQAKFAETKEELGKCSEELKSKELKEHELKSHLGYVETLVQKYEEQIRTMEMVEFELRQELVQEKDDRERRECIDKCERGTQMYEHIPNTNMKFIDFSNHDIDNSSTHSSSEACVQVSFENTIIAHCDCTDHSVQTEELPVIGSHQLWDPISASQKNESEGEHSSGLNTQKEMLERLHQLVEQDVHLQQQLQSVDQMNESLWHKLHNLELHIGECKRRSGAEADSCLGSEWDSRPVSREQMQEEVSSCHPDLQASEREFKERLLRLQQINASFERELFIRQRLYQEKEKEYGEWVQREQRHMSELKRLSVERDSLLEQIEQLKKEREELVLRSASLEADIEQLVDEHNQEMDGMKAERNDAVSQLQDKVNQLLEKEKDHLKQISALKSEKNCEKSESELLKTSYIQLQLELSELREEIKRKEEFFRQRMDDSQERHSAAESSLKAQLQVVQQRNVNCGYMVEAYERRHQELLGLLLRREEELRQLRRASRNSSELPTLETAAISGLAEEKSRLEQELRENIQELQKKEEVYQARIAELEANVESLQAEVARVERELQADGTVRLQLVELRAIEADLHRQLKDMEAKEEIYRENLRQAEIDTRRCQEVYAERMSQLEEQEAAWQGRFERLQEAEKQLHFERQRKQDCGHDAVLQEADAAQQLANEYKKQVDEYEVSEKLLRTAINDLQEENRQLRVHSRTEDGRRLQDVVADLQEAEGRESALLQRMETIMRVQKTYQAHNKDLEKMVSKLEEEMSAQNDLSRRLEKALQDLESSRRTQMNLQSRETDLQEKLQSTKGLLERLEQANQVKLTAAQEEKNNLLGTVDYLREQVQALKSQLDENQQRDSFHAGDGTTEPVYVDIDECLMEAQRLEAGSRSSLQVKSPENETHNRAHLSYSSRPESPAVIKTPQSSRPSSEVYNKKQVPTEVYKDKRASSEMYNDKRASTEVYKDKRSSSEYKDMRPTSECKDKRISSEYKDKRVSSEQKDKRVFSEYKDVRASSENKDRRPSSENKDKRPSSEVYKDQQSQSEAHKDKRLSSDLHKDKTSSPEVYRDKRVSVGQEDSTGSYDSARQNLEDCMLRAMAVVETKISHSHNQQEENMYDEILPRPTDFRIIQRVGSDTLLVGWNYVNTSLLEGYEVYVDGALHERVYAPERSKALIGGLDLRRPLRISICALSTCGQMSDPAHLQPPAQRNSTQPLLQDEENDVDDNQQRPYSMEW